MAQTKAKEFIDSEMDKLRERLSKATIASANRCGKKGYTKLEVIRAQKKLFNSIRLNMVKGEKKLLAKKRSKKK